MDTEAGPSSAAPPRALPPSASDRRTPSCNVSAPSGPEPARIASAADDDMDGGQSADGIGPDDEDALERQEHPDIAIWGSIVRESNPVCLESFLTCCLNTRCGFQPHPRVAEF